MKVILHSSQGDIHDHVHAPIVITSRADLIAHEPEILRRIESTRHGGNLFMIHPFLLFADIGVQITETAREEITAAEPQLATLAEAPYRALKASGSRQRIRVHLRGLFAEVTS